MGTIEATESETDLYSVIKNKIESEISIPNRTAITTEVDFRRKK